MKIRVTGRRRQIVSLTRGDVQFGSPTAIRPSPPHVAGLPAGAKLLAVRVGIDTGGTFTDVVFLDAEGNFTRLKLPSTPGDPARALIEGLGRALAGSGGARLEAVAHGTTVATNAMLEQRFQSLALITTRGFRHVLEIARQSVPSGYGNSYFWVKPERIVPLERVREVTERLDYRGRVITPLDEDDARGCAKWLRDAEIGVAGICFLHSYANPAHERRLQEILLEENPELVLSLSCEVWPEYREYERTVTTLVDAFVKPHVSGYLGRAQDRLREDAPGVPLLIMKSNGGVMPAAAVAERPISTALSGPAAGALGASWLARQAGFRRVITIDTGGTSTDVCLVEDAEPQLTRDGRIGPFPVRVPMIDIVSVGTGGGSIAWIGPEGGLRVGPRSAGADPGPMAYGRGGDQPTVTDAALYLGSLPETLVGGDVPLRLELASRGIRRIGEALGIDAQAAAAGILQLSAHNQANAVQQLTVKRGIDPAGDTLVAFGGAGPLQACDIAAILGLETVLVPPAPGNVSAFGLLAVDLKDDYVTTLVRRHDEVDADEMAETFARLEAAALASLRAQGVGDERIRLLRSVDVRYLGEAHEISIDTGGRFDAGLAERAFHDAHERVYGYAYREREVVEFVNWKVSGVGLIDRPPLKPPPGGGEPRRQAGRAGGPPRYCRDDLPAGFRVEGPVVVDEYGSTTVVNPDFDLEVDRFGNLVLRRVRDARR
ncbi:MAG: hydantoinase/oxoprolinase family protein [Candidatus Dormibacteraeota bacterium]|uniref:Hydantoinase/oxoprolinase family protein n=1 Tax=Candidatus Nephthysia bennettiae TaxID=3127016 RepID=A0A934K874_9BACT|nr:hydantoinase/oxoprolinase family protein [Candidatus Dormibacteraeota bacterium]MBJ7613168.1 hydantoinase/oxoprolinase family protein [Candidatus Dormibacteraeota bacterium]